MVNEDKKLIKAIGLEVSEVSQQANKEAQEYAKNTEFTCLLGGGDPKATIHNLRTMAFASGYEKAYEDLEKAKSQAQTALVEKAKQEYGRLYSNHWELSITQLVEKPAVKLFVEFLESLLQVENKEIKE
jgi:hypothetical protein